MTVRKRRQWHCVTSIIIHLIIFLMFHSPKPSECKMMNNNEGNNNNFQTMLLNFTIDSQYDLTKLTCSIQNPRLNSRIFIACPLLASPRSCFQDCESMCRSENCFTSNLFNDIKCTKKFLPQNNTLELTLWINTAEKENYGNWICSHGGKKSIPITVVQWITTTTPTTTTSSTLETTTTTLSTTKTIIPQPVSLNIDNNQQQPKPSFIVTEKNKSIYDEFNTRAASPRVTNTVELNRSDFNFRWTGNESIVLISVGLLLSLILNVFCCIRCCCMRRYIRSFDKPSKPRPTEDNMSSTCHQICCLDVVGPNLLQQDFKLHPPNDLSWHTQCMKVQSDGGSHTKGNSLSSSEVYMSAMPMSHQLSALPIRYSPSYYPTDMTHCIPLLSPGGSPHSQPVCHHNFHNHHHHHHQLIPLPTQPSGSSTSFCLHTSPSLTDEVSTDVDIIHSSSSDARLNISRSLLAKADNLLREANSLLMPT